MAGPTGVGKEIGVRVLALCGQSLLLEGIEASLQDLDGLKIVQLDTSQPDAIQALDKLNPDIIVFDLTTSQFSCVFTFLLTHTDVVLIGLDIHRDLVLFLSGEWRMLPSVADLMQAIDGWIQVKNSKQL